MEATIVLVLLFTLIVGGMMLALVMGYQSIEESREQQARQRPAETRHAVEVVTLPGFFAQGEDDRMPGRPVIAFDDALLELLEKHVRAEQAVVTQFAQFPSVDSLYRRSGSTLQAD